MQSVTSMANVLDLLQVGDVNCAVNNFTNIIQIAAEHLKKQRKPQPRKGHIEPNQSRNDAWTGRICCYVQLDCLIITKFC